MQLVEKYESGISSTHLTMIYGLGKGSVLKLLKEAGVQMRNHGLMQENFEEAATKRVGLTRWPTMLIVIGIAELNG